MKSIATLAVCLAFALAALGAREARAQASIIHSVSVSGTTLTLRGANLLRAGTAPRVALGGMPTALPVSSASASEIVATLPSGLAPGSYSVVLGHGADDKDEFFFTVGAGGALPSLWALQGLSCVVGSTAGSTVVSVAGSGAVSISCRPLPIADPLGFEALPVDAQTVALAIQLLLPPLTAEIAPLCGGSLTANCTASGPVPIRVRTALADVQVAQVTQTGFVATIGLNVAALDPIRIEGAFDVAGGACTATLDSARGFIPALVLSAGYAFTSRINGGALSVLIRGEVNVHTPLESQDFAGCSPLDDFALRFVGEAISAGVRGLVADRLNVRLCGAPGPELFTPCP